MLTHFRHALTGLALVATVLSPVAVSAQQVSEGRFDVSIRGIRAGQLVFRGEEAGGRYAVAGKLQSTGFVGRLVKFSYDAQSRGSVVGNRYTPTRYTEDADTGKRQSQSVMDYRNGVPQVKKITPPRGSAPYDVAPSTQGGTVDPLTAIHVVLRDIPTDQACKTSVRMFDGRRASQLTLSNPRPSADGILCDGEYRRVAGFHPDDMAERTSFPFTLEYSRQGQALRVEEIRTPTLYGDAILKRR